MRTSLSFTLIVCVLIFPSVVLGLQKEDLSRTQGLVNGRWWGEQHIEGRTAYFNGHADGIRLGGNDALFKSVVITSLTFGEMIDEVDKFYEERANIPIPVTYAMVYIAKKVKGATPSELQDYAASLRKRFNN